jgi:hypothetical protein
VSGPEKTRRRVLAAVREAGGWDRTALNQWWRTNGLDQRAVFAALAGLEAQGRVRHVPQSDESPERWEAA